MAPKKNKKKNSMDFMKVKRKMGRKLQPPKNATNTEIKFKAIILPEQSVAVEKAGLALNKKGLTLKELLQQTSHNNAKVRKAAVAGIHDLLVNHPNELTSQTCIIIICKLRERISDNGVGETLYELLNTVILPVCKQDTEGLVVSLLMTYIFSAMTDFVIEVQYMAFKFSDLVVKYYPNSFLLQADKILESYVGLLNKNKLYFYLHEKGELKTVLDGLIRCLSLLPCQKRELKDAGNTLFAFDTDLPAERDGYSSLIPIVEILIGFLADCFEDANRSFDCTMCLLQSISLSLKFFLCFTGDDNVGQKTISDILNERVLVVFPINSDLQLFGKAEERYFSLNKVIAEIYFHLREWISGPAVSFEMFLYFIESALIGKITGVKSSKGKHLLSLLPFIPKLVSVAEDHWKSRLLKAFTTAFLGCNPESTLKLGCLATINEMILFSENTVYLGYIFDLECHVAWIKELSALLIKLDDKHHSCSQVVLRLLLKFGQNAGKYPFIEQELNKLQKSLQPFFLICLNDGHVSYGPFVRLPSDLQELSLCCIYYMGHLDSELLKSLCICCLCSDMEPSMLFRIIEILDLIYRDGRIQIADHISFFTTLLSKFRIYPDAKLSNRRTFKSLTAQVCSFISQIGDRSLVLQIIESFTVDQISSGLPLDNHCALLRLLCTLDSKPSRLGEQSVTLLGNMLSKYLIDIALEVDEGTMLSYIVPCYIMFDKSHELLRLVIQSFASTVCCSIAKIQYKGAIASILQLFHKDPKIRAIVSLFKEDVRLCYAKNSLF